VDSKRASAPTCTVTEALAFVAHPATVGADAEDTDLLDTVLAALHGCTADLVTIYSRTGTPRGVSTS
jgi:hypothetical protein